MEETPVEETPKKTLSEDKFHYKPGWHMEFANIISAYLPDMATINRKAMGFIPTKYRSQITIMSPMTGAGYWQSALSRLANMPANYFGYSAMETLDVPGQSQWLFIVTLDGREAYGRDEYEPISLTEEFAKNLIQGVIAKMGVSPYATVWGWETPNKGGLRCYLGSKVHTWLTKKDRHYIQHYPNFMWTPLDYVESISFEQWVRANKPGWIPTLDCLLQFELNLLNE